MKSLGVISLLAASAAAFPYKMDQLVSPLSLDAQFQEYKKRMIEARDAGVSPYELDTRQTTPPQGAGALPLAPPPFDAGLQYVSNQGQYAFVAPGNGDERGPCPGLNAMANHGYLPHNGKATISQFISATNKVFGMAEDLGGFLAIYGALVDGDGKGWSIGGSPHTGIGGSHGNYETDSSPLKADLNQYGSNSDLIMSQFYNLYNRQPNAATANYNLEVMRAFRKDRFAESVAKNPYFAYNVFGGIEVSQAAFTFIYRFMSNKSAAAPEGILNKATLKSFMSIYGDDEKNLYHVKGNERIPDNWYKRHPSDEYSIPYFELDILYFASTAPEILDAGCNMGAVNTYNRISPETITNGAYTTKQVLSSPVCYASQYLYTQLAPSLLGTDLTTVPLLGGLFSQLKNITKPLNCASIGAVNNSALAVCPGFSLYGGQTGPVAPGAIQS